jgi:hypothetical protein
MKIYFENIENKNKHSKQIFCIHMIFYQQKIWSTTSIPEYKTF